MYTFLLIVLMSTCCIGRRRIALRSPVRRPLRVHKGYPDTEGKYPYVVAVLNSSHRTCTGSLIAPEWVLTAAHCLTGISTNLYIQYGNMTLPPFQSPFRRKVTKILPYPYYRDDAAQNDIALLKVEPALLPVYGNVSASDFQALIGLAVQYAGYGDTYHSKTKYRLKVQNADKTRPLQLGDGVLVMPPTKYTEYLSVAPRCGSEEQSTLSGDSGGPLFHDGKIIGVLVGGAYDSDNFFTPVSPYIHWISTVIAHHKQNK